MVGSVAGANVDCAISRARKAGSYDQEIAHFDLKLSTQPEDTLLVYIKPSGHVVTLNYKEVQEKKDFRDLHRSRFFSFKRNGELSLTIAYGDVNEHRSQVRKLDGYLSSRYPLWFVRGPYSILCSE